MKLILSNSRSGLNKEMIQRGWQESRTKAEQGADQSNEPKESQTESFKKWVVRVEGLGKRMGFRMGFGWGRGGRKKGRGRGEGGREGGEGKKKKLEGKLK